MVPEVRKSPTQTSVATLLVLIVGIYVTFFKLNMRENERLHIFASLTFFSLVSSYLVSKMYFSVAALPDGYYATSAKSGLQMVWVHTMWPLSRCLSSRLVVDRKRSLLAQSDRRTDTADCCLLRVVYSRFFSYIASKLSLTLFHF